MPKITSLALLAASGALTRKVYVTKGETDEDSQFLEIRGLSPHDILRLVQLHSTPMATLFNKATSGEINMDDVNVAASVLLDQAPQLLADAIMIAADMDRPDLDFQAAMVLPVAVQTQALKAMVELTLVDQTPGEFLQIVVTMLKSTGDLLKSPISRPKN